MYCEWKLLDGSNNSELKSEGFTNRASSTSAGVTWGSKVEKLNVDSIEMLRNCTLQVYVKQTRRLTSCFRNDKVIAQGEKQLDVHVAADCCNDQTIDVPISVAKATSVNCQIIIKF